MQIAASITLVLLHSIWQSGLLLLIFLLLNKIVKVDPGARRNMLLTLLAFQFVLSIATFFLLWLNPVNNGQTIFDYAASTGKWVYPWSVFLLTTYCLIASFKIASHLYDWRKLNKIRQHGLIKPSVDIRLFAITKAFELGVKKVEIWLSDHIQSPLTYGFIKPVILLPVALVNNLSLEETETLIIHELSHISNNDYLLNLFIIFTDSIFYFNPFTCFIVHTIKLEREKSCDIQVLNYKYPAELYAGTLLKAARSAILPGSLALRAISGKNELLNRIQFFTEEINQIPMKKRFNPVSYALLLFVAIFTLFFITGQKKPTPSLTYSPVILPEYQFEINTGATNEAKEMAQIRTHAAVQSVQPKFDQTAKVLIGSTAEAEKEIYDAYAVHAGNHEAIEKEVIIEEEDPFTGKKTTRVFKSTFRKGRWNAQLVYTLTESVNMDSCNNDPARNSEPVIVTRLHPEQ